MSIELRSIDLTSGVNEAGEGFITIAASADTGTILLGQLSPNEVRTMALHWLEVAEAADQDAAVLRCIRTLELPVELAAAIVTHLRASREP